jgi:hypothetical protein
LLSAYQGGYVESFRYETFYPFRHLG